MNTKTLKGLGTAVSLLVGMSFNTVYADPDYTTSAGTDQNWKGYTAVNCQPQSNNSDIRRSAVGTPALSNTGTSATTVYCPVVRDVPQGGENRVLLVRAYVRNRSSVAALRCEFRSHDINGNPHDSAVAVAPPSSDFMTLDMGPVDASNWGSYLLTCQLPGRDPVTNLQSYIINYRVDETL